MYRGMSIVSLSNLILLARLRSANQSVLMSNRLRSLAENESIFKRMVEQPLIFALSSPEPETAIELLERGADPNVLIKERQYSWGAPRPNGGCALDIVRNHLQTLRQYQQDAAQAPARHTLPEGIDTYLDRFEEGTYQYWVVSRAIDNRRNSYEQQLEAYEKQRAAYEKPLGDRRKEAAIAEAILKLEKVQEVLLAKGAKTFSQICPDSTLGIQPRTNQKGTLASQK